jgi:hypothetical protein
VRGPRLLRKGHSGVICWRRAPKTLVPPLDGHNGDKQRYRHQYDCILGVGVVLAPGVVSRSRAMLVQSSRWLKSNQADTEYRRVRTEFHGDGKIQRFATSGIEFPLLRARAKASSSLGRKSETLILLRETPCEPGETPCPLDYFAYHGTDREPEPLPSRWQACKGLAPQRSNRSRGMAPGVQLCMQRPEITPQEPKETSAPGTRQLFQPPRRWSPGSAAGR